MSDDIVVFLRGLNARLETERADRIALRQSNRRVAAEREGWPEGVLEACEKFDETHPDWYTNWRHANTFTGFQHVAGFFARHDGGQYVCGTDLNELDFATQTARLDRHWSYHKDCCEVVSQRRRKK